MIPSPRNLLSLAALIVLGVAVAAILLALRFPVLGVVLAVDADGGLYVAAVDADSPNQDQVFPGSRIGLLDGAKAGPDLLVEEPDQLGDWSRYNALIGDLNRLDRALGEGAIEVVVDGQVRWWTSRERRIDDLPLMFWLQIIVGGAGFLAAAGVFAYRPREPAALHFLLAGLGMLTFATAASIYSTRELVMDGDLLRQLSSLNQFGANFFTAALVALLWVYPSRLSERAPVVPVAYVLGVLIWAGFAFQVYAAIGLVYLLTLLLFALTFVFAALQWKKTRGRPVERAALKWYLLAIYLGTGLFATLILIPVALGIEPPASQGLMFMVFLIMFLGIALGILRFRLFDLDRWWFGAWLWFLGGLAVILVDLALVVFLNMSQSGALLLALGLLGWVYFPIRQWAWSLLMRERSSRARQQSWLRELAAAADEESLLLRWHAALRNEFDPMQLTVVAETVPGPRIEDHGQTLLVPDLIPEQGVRLCYPDRGARLFRREDVHTAQFLFGLIVMVRDAMRERDAIVRGERQRIRRDLHDDLGAKLLSLVYMSDPEGQHIARSAMQDMRDILTALDAEDLALEEAAANWRAEAQARADRHGFALDWSDTGISNRVHGQDPGVATISARQYTNLTRIFREAITNAIRHGEAERIRVDLHVQAGELELRIEDQGSREPVSPAEWIMGDGTRQIQRRAEDLLGKAKWEKTVSGIRLVIAVPLLVDPAADRGTDVPFSRPSPAYGRGSA